MPGVCSVFNTFRKICVSHSIQEGAALQIFQLQAQTLWAIHVHDQTWRSILFMVTVATTEGVPHVVGPVQVVNNTNCLFWPCATHWKLHRLYMLACASTMVDCEVSLLNRLLARCNVSVYALVLITTSSLS